LQGIVMAGGAGSRLRPLTCDLPKPLVPLVNRPVMSYALELLRDLGITDVGITLQYLPEKVKNQYGCGEDYGLNISYFVEDSPLGTAGSVKNTADFLRDTFIVISGDALTDFDLGPAIEFHRQKKALATLVLTRATVPLEYGVVITDSEGRVTKFYEKPAWSDVFSDKVNTGIYILEPEVLAYIPDGTFFDFSKNLFPLLLEKGLGMYGVSLDGYWCDIGDLNQYRQAQYQLLAGNTKWALNCGSQLKPGIRVGRKSVVEPGAKLMPPVVIGDHVYISAGAEIGPLTVIGDRVNINGRASIKQSVIWPEVTVKGDAAIRGAVVGHGVEILPGARIFEGAAVGNGARIASKSTVKPGILIWPEKEVAAEQTVTRNLVWGNPVQDRELSTPEEGLALGRALANLWHKETDVLLLSAGSEQEYFKTILKAMTLGIQASAMHVQTFANIPLPLARFHVIKAKIPGCHLSVGENGEQEPTFLDFSGAFLDNNRYRQLRQLLQRQEFRYAPANVWPEVEYREPATAAYLQAVSGLCRRAATGKMVAVSGLKLPFWARHFHELGHQVIFTESRQGMLNVLEQGQAELGAEISLNGDKLLLYTREGRLLNQRLLQLILSRLLFHYNQGGAVAVPVAVADSAEKIAATPGARVIKTKANPVAYWARLVDREITEKQPRLKQYYLWGDGYNQLIHICDYLAGENLTLADLLRSLPLKPLEEKILPCPWEARGQVFRRLLEMYPREVVDTTDGVMVNYPQGWVLAVPHSTRPEYRILGEAETMEVAKSLTGDLEKKINLILKQS